MFLRFRNCYFNCHCYCYFWFAILENHIDVDQTNISNSLQFDIPWSWTCSCLLILDDELHELVFDFKWQKGVVNEEVKWKMCEWKWMMKKMVLSYFSWNWACVFPEHDYKRSCHCHIWERCGNIPGKWIYSLPQVRCFLMIIRCKNDWLINCGRDYGLTRLKPLIILSLPVSNL